MRGCAQRRTAVSSMRLARLLPMTERRDSYISLTFIFTYSTHMNGGLRTPC